MAVPANLQKIFSHVDSHKKDYIAMLKEAVAIQSVSAWSHTRGEITVMVEWTKKKLEALGATCTLMDIGIQKLPDGGELPLPPVLFGQLGSDPSKKTLCVYGHLDVQPALKEDGWDTEPFVLTEKDGKLFGRGSTDDKGPVIGWINAIDAYQKLNQEIPVNLKFVFEGMEESGSEGLDDLLIKEKDKFLKGTDFVCISDNYWLGKKKPCITYGLRGVCYYFIEVECCEKDLHSGVFGGTVHEAMSDLIALMNTLVDVDGKILIKDLSKHVVEVTDAERKLYEDIDFDVEEYKKDMGAKQLTTKVDKAQTLMNRWRFPSLSLHGIQGAFYEPGCKTVIPRKVIGKFSIRIVPDQTPEYVTKCVTDHLNAEWKKRGSPNKMKTYLVHSGMHWMSDPSHPHYMAGKRAIKLTYGVEPDMTREGCSIPITITFQAYLFHGGKCWMADPNHPNYEAGKRATRHVYGVSPDLTREGGSIPVTLTFQVIVCEGSSNAWMSDPFHPNFEAGKRATCHVYGVTPDMTREGCSIPITITFQVIECEGSSSAWMSDPFHPNFEAGKRATCHVYGVSPDMTREGGSIPITITFQEVTGKNVMLLPMGAADDGAHSQNEKIDVRNYIEGTKLLAAYLYEVAKA